MTIDVRATVTCSLGTLISGSISDDYLQGSGLVKTRGSVELKGLLTPAVGTLVTFSYTKPSGTVTIPRQLRVLSSFADPYRRTTTVELGCLLTYFNNRKPPVSNPNSKEENDTVPCYVYNYATLPISASYVLEQCADALGLTLASNPLTSKFSREEFDLSAGYVQAMSDLLVSESYFGIVKSGTTLEVYSLQESGSTGPVITDADVIDLGPIGVGELPGESVLVRYNTLRLKLPDEADDLKAARRMWEKEVVIGPSQPASIMYVTVNNLIVPVQGFYNPYQATYSSYDRWDRLIQSLTIERSVSSEVNIKWSENLGQYAIVEKLTTQRQIYKVQAPAGPLDGIDLRAYYAANGEAGLAQLLSDNLVADTGTAADCIAAEKPDDYSDVLESITESWVSPLELAGRLDVEGWRSDDGELIEFDPRPILKDSKSIVVYEKDAASGISKTRTETWQANSRFISGQQQLAVSARDDLDFTDITVLNSTATSLLAVASQLKSNGVETRIRTEREFGLQRRPSQSDRNNTANAKANNTENVAEIEWVVGSPESQAVRELSVPLSPDDEIGWTLLGGYTSTPSDAKEKALAYGRVQNRLLLGNRNGLSLQLDPSKIPARPFLPIYLKAGGITAQYRVNACSWAMSAEGVIASTDALLWGAVGADGGAGDAWVPLPPGMTVGDLPSTPTITDGTMTPTVVVPPYEETIIAEARMRVGMTVQRFGYALSILNVPDPIGLHVGILVSSVILVTVPATTISVAAPEPEVRLNIAVRPDSTAIAVAALEPVVVSGASVEVPVTTFTVAALAPDEMDPYAASVVLLLRMDGTNGSTTFTDSSASALTMTAGGNAQISTAQSKAGGASGYFDNTSGTYLTASASVTFSGEYTVEAWVRPTALGFCGIVSGRGYTNGVVFRINGSGQIQFLDAALTTYTATGGSLTTNTWHHVAITRNASNAVTAWLNGSSVGSLGTLSGDHAYRRVAYAGSPGEEWAGYQDLVRLTSVCRYTGTFTPPDNY